MPTAEWLAGQFEAHRAHLSAVAYRYARVGERRGHRAGRIPWTSTFPIP